MTALGGVGVTPRTGHGIARWHDRTIDMGESPAPETVDPGDELAAFERARDAARRGRTSHAAILVRSLAIPAIVQVGDALPYHKTRRYCIPSVPARTKRIRRRT